ncbi:helicase associated domain-containing protein [Capnocytophaga cynodegmi]|uniref:RNA polymerase sigma-70 region 4 domain-containing protein n=1 Tax=Capnocytophaga cynodegmi TaxID=28189 RepID=A0A0B7HCL6_9FLAO|nr:helicase associated domain-containing protein [Capnocytophaga cynodegmi]CEN35303.1 conserved hypothetical protein [Capnocytophaga cynodegmi]CEN39653.1 conserved hypothetical protein [Capnocytophaga cynodegmi]
MTIDEIYNNQEISVRSYNVCMYSGLNTVTELIEYYLRYNNFCKLRNCGQKSNEELVSICNKYQAFIEKGEIIRNIKNPLEEILASLTRVQREVINSFIVINANNLSVRSRNVISKLLTDNFNIRNFSDKILLNKNFTLSTIDNIGKKTIPELEIYIDIVRDFIFNINKNASEKQLIALKNHFLIQQTFSIPKIPTEILQSESIFKIVDFLLKKNAFFSETHNSIIQETLNIYQCHKKKTLEEVAMEYNLSRERIRQIRKDCINELSERLSFIKNFNDDLSSKYGIESSSSLIKIDENLAKQINIRNETDFSKEFISCILAVYLNDNFIVIGNVEDILQPKYSNSKNRHNWNNIYIINKELPKIDLISLANDINKRKSEKIEETYSFNFKSYLSVFMDDINIESINLIYPIVERIVNSEFNLSLNIEDNLIFKRNTIKQAFEYSYEALEILGKPSSIEEIAQKVFELYPDYQTDENKIRASMRRKDGFVPVGRNSVFGLKKWEKELEDFKGGTIRSITYDFLEQFSTPKHITEITEYVLKYRPNSNEKSIYYNLKIDESETFSFFKSSYIGLNNRIYTEDFEILKDTDIIERNSWEERYDDLQNFLLLENRLPFSNGVPEEEIRLYRWLNVQKGKLKTKKLDEQKGKLIIEIYEKFPPINGKRRLNSTEKYDELIEFIKRNQRLPSADKQGEENLYKFFYKQRKLYNNDELNNNEKSYFSKVFEILKNQNL